MSKIRLVPADAIITSNRFNNVIRVRRISTDQLARLTKYGFVVLIETRPGFFSRLVG